MSRVCAEMIERKRPQVTERMLAENISKKKEASVCLEFLFAYICLNCPDLHVLSFDFLVFRSTSFMWQGERIVWGFCLGFDSIRKLDFVKC